MSIYYTLKKKSAYYRTFYLAVAILSVHIMFAQTWDFSSIYQEPTINYYEYQEAPFTESLPSDITLNNFNNPFNNGINTLALADDIELGGVERIVPVGSSFNIFIMLILSYIMVKAIKNYRKIYLTLKIKTL